MNTNSVIRSNESSDCEANPDTLDNVFKDQLNTLRNIILRKTHSKEIDLCQRWLKVLTKTSTTEKIARNCLCALMQHQLEEYGCLGEPFTDLQNCNRDLESVLRELGEQSSNSEQTDSIATYSVHLKPCIQIVTMENRSEPVNNLTECMDNTTLTENVFLRRELESMRLHLTEKQIENLRLKEIVSKYELQSKKYNERCDNLKKVFLKNLEELLQDFETNKSFPLCIFAKVFREFSTDAEFSSKIASYDHKFHITLNNKFQKELTTRKSLIARHVSHTFNKTKTKLRDKYERKLRLQGFVHGLQLKLLKLKCFSILRHIFVTKKCGNREAMLEALKVLEEKYQDIINEIL